MSSREITLFQQVYLDIYAETYSDLVNDFPNLWLKAHVQHSVSLIKHKVRASTEVGLSCLQEVNESAWSGNADLHTFKVIMRS